MNFFLKKKNIYQILKFLNNNYIFKNFFQFILIIHQKLFIFDLLKKIIITNGEYKK